MKNDFEIAKNLLEINGKISGVTSGKSMYPLFRDGKDSAIIKQLPQKLKVNDVVLYRKKSTNELILHRIVKFSGTKPILRGDSHFYNETNVLPEDIIGIMEGFYRSGKYYECKKSFKYKLYVFWLRSSFPLRRVLRKIKNIIKK